MNIDKRLIYAFVAGLAVAYWMHSGGSAPVPSPFNPMPSPQHDRPVLRMIARAAKTALWFMLIAEPAPEQRQMAQHAVGDDGFPVIDHARAF